MSWTDERVELLKKLWQDGLSASQIASELGGVTRNAVIGKVHRLGLSGRAKTSRPAAPRPRKPARRPSMPPRVSTRVVGNTALKLEAAPVAEVRPMRVLAPVEELFIPPEERATILQLTEHTCKWPIGDPSAEDFYFCGRHSVSGMPYCEHHASVAYQPADRRKQRSAG